MAESQKYAEWIKVCKNTYNMIPFLWNSGKIKLIYRKQINGWRWYVENGGAAAESFLEVQRTFWGDGYVLYLDRGDDMGVHNGQNSLEF